uniref:UvrD-like helicase C-terminal domain-containing protein n=1 Tax=uncultured Candidatus Melainabacteria bacterium TaxID=2682970 RepID=A0A650EJZ3_9BACT|nr:hypothetical protein Melaina855_1490 [uncultured Candidatus Melainabacteria bacterium]
MKNIHQEIIERHIKTHTVQSDEDCSAVTMLKAFLRSNGKIAPNFAHGDKWPNIDGTFEFVPNPNISKRPKQNFSVQIKGTMNCDEKDGIVKYNLKSLGFPAYIYTRVTFDPGILFVVFNPNDRGNERVFWKYMSADFVNSINYEQESTTIYFSTDEEIKNTEASINDFCNSLCNIIEHHGFLNQLDDIYYSKEDLVRIIEECNKEICEDINRLDILNDTRDNVSKRLLKRLDDLCKSILLLNLLNENEEKVNIKLAWERAILNIRTKYLAEFYKALKYLGNRIPVEGQSERLMIKYYNFLWQIRKFLKERYNLSILENLEQFPLYTDTLDQQYYELVARVFNSNIPNNLPLSNFRYYIQKKIPFFVNGERYYEITLQLAGVYATKYNRITAYTKEDISTDYSIQIGYTDEFINLWDVNLSIKIITNWSVSIDPKCLNRLAKILKISTKLSPKYGEYKSLMEVLTETGINFLELIDLQDNEYSEIITKIYNNVNTTSYKDVLDKLRNNYSFDANTQGYNTIRYLIIDLKEETINNVLPTPYNQAVLSDEINLSRRCFPFEKNPYISNLIGKKTSENSIKKLIDVAGIDKFNIALPYLLIKREIDKTGEIYFEENTITSKEETNHYNMLLDSWEQRAGYKINNKDHLVCIDSYEKTTLYILKKLIEHSQKGIKGQDAFNKNYLKNSSIHFTDPLKEQALKDIFVDSSLLLIYGAAGTGKTTLINYISNMMTNSRKLFLTKTHTALQNLKRRIDNVGVGADFVSFDSFTKRVNLPDYDIIFVDECSTIDNRKMYDFFNKIKEDTLLVLAGDIHQIESIDFGNWFFYAKNIIKKNGASVELLNTWRTQDDSLKSLWNEVRNRYSLITEKLVIDGPFSENIGVNILNKNEKDEVILCLNYDGKFGLNNMNNYFQNANPNKAVAWQEWSYKINDPILFNDSKRFTVLYNNLKGKIVNIEKTKNEISFTIDIDIILTEKQCEKEDIDFIEIVDDNTTRICIKVYKYDSNEIEEYSEIMEMNSVVPFQLAYAVSIHKAQGLEYDSVKIIIPSSNSEKITHGIFYTAITRAKKNLKIFWSPEAMNKIVNSFNVDDSKQKSLNVIKNVLS